MLDTCLLFDLPFSWTCISACCAKSLQVLIIQLPHNKTEETDILKCLSISSNFPGDLNVATAPIVCIKMALEQTIENA